MGTQDFPPSVIVWAQQQLAMYGRVGCVDILRVPDLSAPVPVLSEVAAPALQFVNPGTILGLYGQEEAGTTAKFATTEVRIQIGSQVDVVTQGRAGGTYAPLLGLVGPNMNWFPLCRRADVGVPWNISYRNRSATATAVPVILFAFIADKDISEATSYMNARGGK